MAKTIMKKFLWLVMITAIFGCSKSSERGSLQNLQERETVAADESDKQPAAVKPPVKERKIIKSFNESQNPGTRETGK